MNFKHLTIFEVVDVNITYALFLWYIFSYLYMISFEHYFLFFRTKFAQTYSILF